jgi:hypothetical protein
MKTEPNNNDIRHETPATWWTTTGWRKKAEPKVYANMSLEGNSDWEKLLKKTGYRLRTHCGGRIYDPFSIKIYEYRNSADKVRHLLVVIYNEDGRLLSLFFVDHEDQMIFFADWYSSFVKEIAVLQQAEMLQRIAKTLVAFVRHGHGCGTIDENAQRSFDNQQNLARHQAYEQARPNLS